MKRRNVTGDGTTPAAAREGAPDSATLPPTAGGIQRPESVCALEERVASIAAPSPEVSMERLMAVVEGNNCYEDDRVCTAANKLLDSVVPDDGTWEDGVSASTKESVVRVFLDLAESRGNLLELDGRTTFTPTSPSDVGRDYTGELAAMLELTAGLMGLIDVPQEITIVHGEERTVKELDVERSRALALDEIASSARGLNPGNLDRAIGLVRVSQHDNHMLSNFFTGMAGATTKV